MATDPVSLPWEAPPASEIDDGTPSYRSARPSPNTLIFCLRSLVLLPLRSSRYTKAKTRRSSLHCTPTLKTLIAICIPCRWRGHHLFIAQRGQPRINIADFIPRVKKARLYRCNDRGEAGGTNTAQLNTKSTKTHAATENAMQKPRVNRKRSVSRRAKEQIRKRGRLAQPETPSRTLSRVIGKYGTGKQHRAREIGNSAAEEPSERAADVYAKQTFERGRNFFCATYHRTKPASSPAARTPHAKSLLAE